MEFEKALRLAGEYLTIAERFIDPKEPQGIWFCANAAEVSDIQINAAWRRGGVGRRG
mgnify:CR=1 FL=1